MSASVAASSSLAASTNAIVAAQISEIEHDAGSPTPGAGDGIIVGSSSPNATEDGTATLSDLSATASQQPRPEPDLANVRSWYNKAWTRINNAFTFLNCALAIAVAIITMYLFELSRWNGLKGFQDSCRAQYEAHLPISEDCKRALKPDYLPKPPVRRYLWSDDPPDYAQILLASLHKNGYEREPYELGLRMGFWVRVVLYVMRSIAWTVIGVCFGLISLDVAGKWQSSRQERTKTLGLAQGSASLVILGLCWWCDEAFQAYPWAEAMALAPLMIISHRHFLSPPALLIALIGILITFTRTIAWVIVEHRTGDMSLDVLGGASLATTTDFVANAAIMAAVTYSVPGF